MARKRNDRRESGMGREVARRQPARDPRAALSIRREALLQEARAALGSVLHRKGVAPLRRHPDRGVPDRPLPDVAQGTVKRDEPQRDTRQLALDTSKLDSCKSRPSERASRGGAGGSRPFVPWCDRR